MYTLFIVYVLIIALICALIASRKFRKLVAIVIIASLLFAAVLTLHGAARAEDLKQGIITRVAPEIFNDYPILIVTVETFDGEVYTYFAEEEIDVQGIIILVLFGEEVVDVKEAF